MRNFTAELSFYNNKSFKPHLVMIKRRIEKVSDYIFADKEDFTLEHRILLYAIVIGILASILGGIINFFLAPSAIAVIIPFILYVFLTAIYYFIRFKNIFYPFATPVTIVGIIGISTIWVFNGGINGSNIMPAFIILILGILVVPVKSKKYIVILFITVNILILLIQFYRPDLIINFPNETIRWIQNLITLIICSYFIYIIIRFIHKNYTLERLRAEKNEKKSQQLNADKDRFISILGHDLKTPFNNILGLSEILTKEINSLHADEIKEIAGNINKSAQITNKLLEDILMWARTQQGKIPFKPQILSIKDICKDTIELLIPNANAKNITINHSATDNVNVLADIDMLKTLLRNLVSNAIKFTNTGGTINISAVQSDSNIEISVSDNGVGIAPGDLTILFDVGKAHTTLGTAKERGTGLGLLLCRDFVEKQGGKIWVESETGKGSEFKFTLPVSITTDNNKI